MREKQERILNTLKEIKDPIWLNELARKCRLSRQLVRYHLLGIDYRPHGRGGALKPFIRIIGRQGRNLMVISKKGSEG